MSISRMMAEQVKQSEDSIGVLGKVVQHFIHSWASRGTFAQSKNINTCGQIFCFALFIDHSHFFQDGAGNQRRVQKHDRNHPPGEETHPQVQPARADRQAAHLPRSGSLPRHGPLHLEETPLPFHLAGQLFIFNSSSEKDVFSPSA